MIQSVRIATCLACLAVLALAAGCGNQTGGDVKKVPVSGTIMLDGEPLANAEVNFVSKEFAGFGKTDSEGKFELVQGAAPGENRVWISKIKAPEGYSPDPAEGLDEGQIEAAASVDSQGVPGSVSKKAGQLVPAIYSDPEKTKLTFKVPEDGTDSADFNLKSK